MCLALRVMGGYYQQGQCNAQKWQTPKLYRTNHKKALLELPSEWWCMHIGGSLQCVCKAKWDRKLTMLSHSAFFWERQSIVSEALVFKLSIENWYFKCNFNWLHRLYVWGFYNFLFILLYLYCMILVFAWTDTVRIWMPLQLPLQLLLLYLLHQCFLVTPAMWR